VYFFPLKTPKHLEKFKKKLVLDMQNARHIAQNAGHTAQNDGHTMQNVSRTIMSATTHLMFAKDQRGVLMCSQGPRGPPYPYT